MRPQIIATIIFLLTYIGIALGSVPGLAIDRTAIALIGAIVMLTTHILNEREAFRSIDAPTILLLYSLMVLSAQFTLSGLYARIASGVVRYVDKPETFLGALIGSSAVLSALIANDIVCLAFTPVICVATLRASLNPVPFILALCCASNIGSAATIMGNPQNMLIGQVGGLPFEAFVRWCLPPAMVSLVVTYAVIMIMYRGKWADPSYKANGLEDTWPPYDTYQAAKAVALICILIVLFCTRIPRELSALGIAALVVVSRKIESRSILGLVDWHLITLFCALFIVVEGVLKYNLPQESVSYLASTGYDINQPLVLSAVTLVLSSMVSNVPAVMLLLRNIDPGNSSNLYLLAVVSTFAGNLLVTGSIANLIALEQARHYNVSISFWSHARVGLPVTALSIAVALAWALLPT